MSGSNSGAYIPLYVFPDGSGAYKIGIQVSLDGGTTYQMYEFDTGAPGFWAAYNPSWVTNGPGSITAQTTYTSGIQYQAGLAAEPIAFAGTIDGQGTLLAVNSGTVAVITNASNSTGSNPFTNAQWQSDVANGKAPLYGNFFGDFGMGLGTSQASPDLFAILPQLPGTLSNGFIIDLGQYPTNPTAIGDNAYVQVGSVQVGLTPQDLAAFPYIISMQGQDTQTPFPNSGQPTYQEVLANGTLELRNDVTSASVSTGFVFDTGAPTTAIHAGSIVTADILDQFVNGGSVGGDVATGTNVTLSAPGSGTPDWQLGFQAGTTSGVDRVSTGTLDVINDPNGYVNTGLQPFFDGRVMYDVHDGVMGFSPYTWQGTMALPAGFNSNYTEILEGATTLTVPGLAHIGGQLSGTGPLTIGSGTVDLEVANTFTGGIFINGNATLDIGDNNAGGMGAIDFTGVGTTLKIDAGVTPTETIGGLQQGDFIDVAGINGGTVTVSGTQLAIANGTTSLTLSLDTSYSPNQFRVSPDGSGGTMISYVSASQPYVIPIYHGIGPNPSLIIYASLNGGPLDPYLLDSGSPNMFSVYGSWWPGFTTQVMQQGTASFSFASGTTYWYDTVPTSIGLGTGPGGTVVASATNVNVAQITNVNADTPAQDFANWSSAVANGNAPFGSDNTYGNFSAGLYGSNMLATVLAQIPIGGTLDNGFIIAAGPTTASVGSLTVGIDPNVLAQWEANPSTIILQMQTSGNTLPNPDGNAHVVNGYQKAQVGNTTVTLTPQSGAPDQFSVPLVIDTGGGPNNIIYNPGGTPDLSGYLQPDSSSLKDNTGFTLTGTTPGGAPETILSYTTGPNALPTGGNTDAIADPNIPGTLRINPGYTMFDNYNVMFDLSTGEVLLQPTACFAAGTRIATPDGERPVEALAIGDAVCTASGDNRPIIWIGRRAIDCTRHASPDTVLPVRIVAGAFGPAQPNRDLLLSPDHAVFFDDVLIPVKYLINGRTIRQTDARHVVYFHIELPRHAIVLANGLPTESYLECGERGAFSTNAGVEQLHPRFAPPITEALLHWEAHGCAPLVVIGEPVSKAHRLLAQRAKVLRRNGGRVAL